MGGARIFGASLCHCKNTAVDVGFSAYYRHTVRKQKDTLRACLFVDIIFVRCYHSGRRSNLAPNFEGVGTMNETSVTLLLFIEVVN